MALRKDPGDQSAWSAFVDRYGPEIHAWCLRFELQDADAQDITQMVMLKLVRHLPEFPYDPSRSFRGWLRTLTAHSWSDFIRDQVRGVRGAADPVVTDLLDTVEARVDLVRHLEVTYDRELLELAMAEVRERVEPHTWEAFRSTAIEGVAAARVAARLGIAVATVYRARHVVQGMLREAVARLDSAEDAPG
jgi:RNA polymerase sigma-70 factor (ECF subfamily)